jgi:hypothetical protein
MTRQGGTTIGSIFTVEDDRARDRVLRATFWRPPSRTSTSDPVSLDAYRAARARAQATP